MDGILTHRSDPHVTGSNTGLAGRSFYRPPTTTEEVVRLLKSEGLLGVSAWRIRHAMKTGKVPKPQMNSGLVFVWTEEDVGRVRKFMTENPEDGRKTKKKIES